MKYIINTLILTVASFSCFAQVMQASIGIGSSPSRVMIYLKPDVPINGNISTLQYDVAISDAILPIPTISIVGVPPIGNGWIIQPAYTEGGYRHYEILTASVFNINMAAVETPAMELEFNGGPVAASDVSLVTLPFAGSNTGNALFYCTGVASSVSGQLYYTRSGTTVLNNDSYNGGPTSYATVTNIVLPVKWLSFNVVRHGDDGLLKWTVANQDETHHYEIERSSNGSDFTKIATVNRSANSNYDHTDINISGFAPATFYYRIKQVDINGRYSYSDIKTLRMDKEDYTVKIYPNPVTKGFYLNMQQEYGDNNSVKLNLFGANGQLVASRSITSLQAVNYYFDITDKKLAAGHYNLQILIKEKMELSKKIIINQ